MFCYKSLDSEPFFSFLWYLYLSPILDIIRTSDLARNIDRRIGLERIGQIQYVVVGYKFRVNCEFPSELHIRNAYRNIFRRLIILRLTDTPKKLLLLDTIFMEKDG